jgi:hypothetical protein
LADTRFKQKILKLGDLLIKTGDSVLGTIEALMDGCTTHAPFGFGPGKAKVGPGTRAGWSPPRDGTRGKRVQNEFHPDRGAGIMRKQENQNVTVLIAKTNFILVGLTLLAVTPDLVRAGKEPNAKPEPYIALGGPAPSPAELNRRP